MSQNLRVGVQKIKRVLVFTTAYKPFIGGSEIAIEETIKLMPDIFFEILTPKYSLKLKRVENFSNGFIHRIGLGTKMDKFLFPVLGFFTAIRSRPDIIHGYQAAHASGAAVIYKFFSPKTKFILTIQEGKNMDKQNLLIRFFRKIIIKRADVVTAISSYLVDYVRNINPKAETHLIPNGVDLNKLKNKRKNLKNIENVIITVSRLVPKNGIADLINAIKILKDKIPEIRLWIVGDGPLRRSLDLQVLKMDLQKNVLFFGSLEPDLVPEYLSQAKVFVRPSLSEGLGNYFLEAMAVQVPIIGTPVGGITDFLRDGETGLFCKVSDPVDLAEKINKILTDKEMVLKIT